MLGKWASRFDPDLDDHCPLGCREIEDTVHVLIQCPELALQRNTLTELLLANNLKFTLLNLLGLNPDICSSRQLKIRNELLSFLKKTDLLYRN